MTSRILVCTAIVIGIAFLGAQASGPRHPTEGEDCFLRGEFPVSDWSIRGLSVGNATLDDVKSTLGYAPPFRLGSDALSTRALCYAHSEDVHVIFEASPMGGAAGLLTGITATAPSNEGFERHCVQPKKSAVKLLEVDQELRKRRIEFEKLILLQPCFRNDDRTAWKFEKVVGEWSTLSGLKARFVDDRVVWWKVFLVESS